MKRPILYLVLLFVVLVITGCKKPVEIYMAYDPIDGYKEPSDSSEVVHHWTNYGGEWEILEKDSTGQFGRIRLAEYFFRHEDQWMPLDQMVYAGSMDPNERLETFVVKPEEIKLHNHPKMDKNEVSLFPLFKGDTVQGTAREKGWVHVRKLNYNRTEYSSNIYGWIPEKELTKIDSMTRGELEEIAYQKAWAKEEEILSKTYLPGMRGVHEMYRDACEWIAGFALIFWLVFLIPARRRGEEFFNRSLLWLWILLTVTVVACRRPSWFFFLQIPLMVYVATYPLLYFRTAVTYRFLYPLLTLGASGYYLYYMSNGWSRTFVLIVLAVLIVVMAWVIAEVLGRDICPRCGYFCAFHSSGSKLTDREVEKSTETIKSKVGEKTEKKGNVVITTEYYQTGTRDVTTTTEHFEHSNVCVRCGKPWTYHTVKRTREAY